MNQAMIPMKLNYKMFCEALSMAVKLDNLIVVKKLNTIHRFIQALVWK